MTGDSAGCVRVYDVASRQLLCTLPATDRAAISCINFSVQSVGSGSHMESVPCKNAVRESLSKHAPGAPQASLHASASRVVLAAGTSSGHVRVYTIGSSGLETLISDAGTHGGPVTGVAFAERVATLWTCGQDGILASLDLGVAHLHSFYAPTILNIATSCEINVQDGLKQNSGRGIGFSDVYCLLRNSAVA